jgi:carboxyl-terminal processing protease
MSQRWSSGLFSVQLALALCCSALCLTARAQTPSATESVASSTEAKAALDQGLKLERDRRWGEALQYYEHAVKSHPNRRELEERLVMSRSHYDVTRRYGDDSYIRSIGTMTERDALKILDEVLEKVDTHYVNNPNWTDVVRRGTLSFDVALSEDAFRKKQLAQVSADDIARFRSEFNKTAATLAPRDTKQVTECAIWAGKAASQRLGIKPAAVIMEYVCGAVAALDEYSSYLTAAQLEEVFSQIEGNFVGLGVELKSEEHALLVVNVIPSGPAEKGGLRNGDRIISVQGQSLETLSPDTAADMLRGEEGTQVAVVVQGIGTSSSKELTLTRERVEVPCVEGVKMIDPANGVGYLKLNSFQKTTPRDVDTALWKLHRDGMKTVILDLRGNPGGLLNAAVELADKFIYDGAIVTTRGRNPREDYSYTAHTVGTWRVPIVVLIDADSASASEIFAGAIRDRHRGLVVGERSYGKGSVQGIFPLSASKGGVRLTTAKFFSPSGQAISRNGVTPDVAVRITAKPPTEGGLLAPENDSILKAGLQVARDQLSKR